MDEAIKRDAYLKGLQLKNTGLDEEIILIRLEKQGIPYDLAKEVAANVFLQRKVDAVNKLQPPNPFGSRGSIIMQFIYEMKLRLQIWKSEKNK
jgi:hypothetical protein